MPDAAGGRSKIERDDDVREFVAARIGRLTYRELADLARRRFGPTRAPSQSAIGRWAKATGQQRPRPASKIERNPELREFIAARVALLTYQELEDRVREHFGPARAVSHTAIARWAIAAGRRRRLGWLGRIDADPALSVFLEDRADRMSVQALAERARAAFGDRAPPRGALHRWDARRRVRLRSSEAPGACRPHDGTARRRGACERANRTHESDLHDATAGQRGACAGNGRGRPAPEMPLEQRARCSWCDRGFRPRKGTGGSPQRFCGAPCRRAFHSAARRYVQKAIAEGRLKLTDLRTLPHVGATSAEMAA